MRGRSIAIASVGALGAQAVLLPPGLSATRDGAAVEPILDPKSQSIHLPCPACAFASSASDNEDYENDRLWTQGGANDIVLNFHISGDNERLEINGQPIYPPQFHRDAYLRGDPIYVYQVPASASDLEVLSGDARSTPLEVTSSGLKIEAEHAVTDDNDAIIPLKFQIMGLDREPIELDEVAIDLLRTSDGELLMLRVENLHNAEFLPFLPTDPLEDDSNAKECTMLPTPICKLKSLLQSKISAMRHGHWRQPRPCSGRLPADMKSKFHEGHHRGKDEHHGRPHHMRPYWSQHGSHRGGFLHAFARGLIAILIPVLAGITVGLSVSFIGLVVGRLIGYLWIRFARGGRRGPVQRSLVQTPEDRGKMLAYEDDVEPLPAYEDAPPYQETDEEKR